MLRLPLMERAALWWATGFEPQRAGEEPVGVRLVHVPPSRRGWALVCQPGWKPVCAARRCRFDSCSLRWRGGAIREDALEKRSREASTYDTSLIILEGAADGEATCFERRGTCKRRGSTPPPSARQRALVLHWQAVAGLSSRSVRVRFPSSVLGRRSMWRHTAPGCTGPCTSMARRDRRSSLSGRQAPFV